MRCCVLAALVGLGLTLGWAAPPATGPDTEKRFPPLRVPQGFKATLFACDPLIEYPSAIAAGPRPGAVFVAYDYMTGLGTDIVRRDEIHLVEDTDGDGYADKATLYAKGFNSIMGLAYHQGTLFVMHAPYLTALRDTKGSGQADERKDLLAGLGLPPEQNPVRLHCANGVTVGHDGWLYLALGDNGVNVPRPEGDRLVLNGGGILRCRLDGRDLHVFARGLRNIYDVALDAELNAFVRDNENDGGTYKIRVCHSFFGADHGYPYLYYERPEEALPPLADLGLGSSAGGVCYLENQLSAEYRGSLFFCEWGRSLVNCRRETKGSGFGPVKEVEFAAGADNDPYGFKPTDIVVQPDGALLVADWCDGQRPKRGRGRIYRITHSEHAPHKPLPAPKTLADELARLDDESYRERTLAQFALEARGKEGADAVRAALAQQKLSPRGTLHAVWVLARAGQQDDLFDLASQDQPAPVRVQAVRALADLADPVLVKHRLDAGPGAADTAKRLAELGVNAPPSVQREVIIALGRLQWADTPAWLQKNLGEPDAAMAHAAQQALRGCKQWPATLALLDLPDGPVREVALRTLADISAPAIVDGLLKRLPGEKEPARRRQYADLLTRVCRQKPAEWTYWGYRPPPRPANSVTWEQTKDIEAALNRLLDDPDGGVRLAVLQRMQREGCATRLETLNKWLTGERQPESVALILDCLREHPSDSIRASLEQAIREQELPAASRLKALALFGQGLQPAAAPRLRALIKDVEDGPVLAEAIRLAGKFPGDATSEVVAARVGAKTAAVRAAVIDVLGSLQAPQGKDLVADLLADQEAVVRESAARAAGNLQVRATADTLLKLAHDPAAGVRAASLDALTKLAEPRAVPLALNALTDRQTEVAAIHCLARLGNIEQVKDVVEAARRSPSAEVLTASLRALTGWADRDQTTAEQRRMLDRAVAEIQGASGTLERWQVVGPLSEAAATQAIKDFRDTLPDSRRVFAAGAEPRLRIDAATAGSILAVTSVVSPAAAEVEFLAASNGTLQVWLNGAEVFDRARPVAFQASSDRFAGKLAAGVNRLLVKVDVAKWPAEFHVRFRLKSASAEHEKLIQAALARAGNVERGRALFFNADKSLCLKCHRVEDKGEAIGPELTGVGSRFSRVYLVESILQPGRTIAPSFGSLAVVLKSGKVLNGIKVAEDGTSLTLANNEGVKLIVARSDIEEMQPVATSTMPDGLEKRLTPDEFVDLIAFLASQRATPR